MELVHLTTFDTVKCKNHLLARSLGAKHSVYIADSVLKDLSGVLRLFRLKPDHVPLSMTGQLTPIPLATCQSYLQAGQTFSTHHTMSAVFPDHNLFKDFDEVELGSRYWQPKLDAVQAQLDDLNSTYATDAEVVAAFAEQIAAAGDIFQLIDTKVLVETTRELGSGAGVPAV